MLRVEFRMKFSAEKKIARKGLGGVVKTIGSETRSHILMLDDFIVLLFIRAPTRLRFLARKLRCHSILDKRILCFLRCDSLGIVQILRQPDARVLINFEKVIVPCNHLLRNQKHDNDIINIRVTNSLWNCGYFGKLHESKFTLLRSLYVISYFLCWCLLSKAALAFAQKFAEKFLARAKRARRKTRWRRIVVIIFHWNRWFGW